MDTTTTTTTTITSTVSKPEYSKEPILDGIEHLGHWLHVGFHDTVDVAIVTIKRGVVVADDLRVQLPTLGADTATVAVDALQCKALAAAVALVVAGGGVDIAADAGVLAALVTDGPALIKLFTDGAALVKLAGVDISTDANAIS
jgi:ABC-type transporter Mla maintaining outer membrane lipid asymmetry permease subunit MlaE